MAVSLSWKDQLSVLLVRGYIQEWDTLDLEVQVEVLSTTPGHNPSPNLLPKHLPNVWQSDKVHKEKEALGQAS